MIRGSSLAGAFGPWVERKYGSHSPEDLATFARACAEAQASETDLTMLGDALASRADDRNVAWIWKQGSGHDLAFWTGDQLAKALEGAFRAKQARASRPGPKRAAPQLAAREAAVSLVEKHGPDGAAAKAREARLSLAEKAAEERKAGAA